MAVNRQDFINRTRRLASVFVQASDAFNALSAEMNYTDGALPVEQGGLGPEDFIAGNSDLAREDLLAFYETMGALLAPLTVEQKKLIYKVMSRQAIVSPGSII